MIFSIKWGQSLIQMWRVILINEFMVQDSDIRGVWNEIHDIVNPGVKTYSSLLVFIMLCSMTLNWIPHSLINSSQLTLQCTNRCGTLSPLLTGAGRSVDMSDIWWDLISLTKYIKHISPQLTQNISFDKISHSKDISHKSSYHSSLKLSHSTKYLIPQTILIEYLVRDLLAQNFCSLNLSLRLSLHKHL